MMPGNFSALQEENSGSSSPKFQQSSTAPDDSFEARQGSVQVTPTAIGFYNTQHRGRPMKAVAVFATVHDLNWNLAAGIASPDAALLDAVNAALDKLTAAGTIKAIYARYGVTLAPPR
jgi:ABC-type amino acid transport substrate-binding protein